MRNLLLLVFCLGAWMSAQGPPPPPPAPPPPRPERQAAPVSPIRVGGGVQSPYFGPAALWFQCCGNTLSDDELASLELSDNPEDVCVRGQFIANWHPTRTVRHSLSRIDDLIWMIQHYPQWDGFLLDPRDSLTRPRSEQERLSYKRLHDAWLRQVEPDQRDAAVLHNAAMFFAIPQPELAISLLQRAIHLEPGVAIHVERLGMVYALLHVPARVLEQYSVQDNAARRALAQQTEVTLLESDDWVLLGGALDAILHGGKPVLEESTRDLAQLLVSRLNALRPGEDSIQRKLPSRTARYHRTECDARFLKRVAQ